MQIGKYCEINPIIITYIAYFIETCIDIDLQ